MYNVSIEDLINLTNAKLIQGDKNLNIENLNIDTRTIKKGQIFVAIEKGNEYIEIALQKGAIGIISEIEPSIELIKNYPDITIVKVKNSINAIQKIAKFKREKYYIPVVAITGSVGKTSTKDIVAKVLSQKYKTLKTEGNYNNHIGVPLTILRLTDHEALVVEMGMNHFGEISALTNIAKPTIAVITNIGTSHIGILGSRENILKAKLEILEGLMPNGKIVINNDDDLLNKWNNDKKLAITYGIENKSDIQACDIKISELKSTYKVGKYTVNVPISGTHFIYNSLCAIAVGNALNIDMNSIIKGISEFELTKKRMEIKKSKGCTIINDSYNASYESMKYALEYLKNINGKRKIAVLGDMLELGIYSKDLHEKVGEEVNVDILITVGKEAKNISNRAIASEIYNFDCNKEATEKLKEIMMVGDVILFKASNGMRFSEIIQEICE